MNVYQLDVYLADGSLQSSHTGEKLEILSLYQNGELAAIATGNVRRFVLIFINMDASEVVLAETRTYPDLHTEEDAQADLSGGC